MADAEHFLSRLQRLEREHVELALRLYYDHRLVAHIVALSGVPEQIDRVAISLDDDSEGPFIVVTREGRFVTCLGRGMKHDRPIITRHKLDLLAGRAESLRAVVREAERDRFRYRDQLLYKVIDAGDRLSREEFEHVAAWLPLLAAHYFDAMIAAARRAREIVRIVRPAKKLGARHDAALRDYWAATWAIAHFALVLGSDNGECLEELLAELPTDEPRKRKSSLFPWTLVQSGVSSFAARGAWVASKLPRLLLSELKEDWSQLLEADSTISLGLGLAAIGLRHGHRRAEVAKALRRDLAGAVEGSSPRVDAILALRRLLAVGYEAAARNGDERREHTVAMARRVIDTLAEEHGPGASADIPDETAIAVVMAMPLDLQGDYLGLRYVLESLPWIVRAQATDFYLPETWAAARRGPWQREEGLALIEPRLQRARAPKRPARSEAKPGRNDPCPCGSNKKYKRCCGSSG